jgi:hypothetical protein
MVLYLFGGDHRAELSDGKINVEQFYTFLGVPMKGDPGSYFNGSRGRSLAADDERGCRKAGDTKSGRGKCPCRSS